MRKTDKKRESQIIRELTKLCETAKFEHEGFVWLTHEVDYQRFTASLMVTLVFSEQVGEEVMLSEFKKMIPEVQSARKPVIGAMLPVNQIEARFEQVLQ